MTALRKNGREIHVGYSTNVHRSESLANVAAFLDGTSVEVRRRVLPGGGRLGLDLRLGAALVRELTADLARVPELAADLDARGLYVFGVNGFPLGDFQAAVVKDDAYRPDWSEPARLEATEAMGEILARLLPEDGEGAVSTVAGGYRPCGDDATKRDAMAAAMVRAATAFARLREETGRTVALAPEPEPDTTMDDAQSVRRFYRDHLRPAARRLGPRADEILHRHLPVCLDACHLSVGFEEPAATIAALEADGIRVGKANISCCPTVRDPARNPAGRRFLTALDEPRFLHQTRGRDAGGRVRLRLADLGAFRELGAEELADLAEIRSHFHVPLFGLVGHGFATTRDETAAFLAALLERSDAAAMGLAVETYTWHVFAHTPLGRTVGSDLVQGLTREIGWTLETVERLGWTRAATGA
ncbi:MAG: metabolite traffic protein EboE [Planctomycetes bacterium]|nr:metabolite traffic protein EboE [Planctomycetota bacterium]